VQSARSGQVAEMPQFAVGLVVEGLSQQALPAAVFSGGSLNSCLRSPRIRRVGRARRSLPHPTPLLLCAISNGRCAVQQEYGVPHAGCRFSQLEATSPFVRGRAGLVVGGERSPSLPPSKWGTKQVMHRLLFRSTLGAGPFGCSALVAAGLGSSNAAVSSAAGRAWANPSVKGTSCGKPQAAPYLER
jgi:hypothetical protein